MGNQLAEKCKLVGKLTVHRSQLVPEFVLPTSQMHCDADVAPAGLVDRAGQAPEQLAVDRPVLAP